MRSNKIAISHPGKIGDAIFSLPSARALCKKHGMTCDFYTSEYCLPLQRLFAYQWYIDRVIVPPDYQIERMDIGIQPWRMPIKVGLYECVYHLGFRYVPNTSLPDFMAASIGLQTGLPIKYEYPLSVKTPDEPYIVMAARGETTYKDLFLKVIEKSPIRVIQIGGEGEYIGNDPGITGLDMLETTAWIANAEAYVGLMSSQLALANGFDIPKVAPHDGASWDMRHVVKGPRNFYPINPSAEEIITLALETPRELVYSKSLNPIDYNYFTEDQHVRNVIMLLGVVRAPFRFEHHHRAWEYGIVLNALRKYDVGTVLDVGGGGSVFAPAAAYLHMDVTQVDMGEVGHWISAQAHALELEDKMRHEQVNFMDYGGGMFDAVTCISTLEHIEKDIDFFLKLFSHAKRMVAITVDFSEDGRQYTSGHIRTYDKDTLVRLIKIAAKLGFTPAGGNWDYEHYGEYVNGYSFASLILVKPD